MPTQLRSARFSTILSLCVLLNACQTIQPLEQSQPPAASSVVPTNVDVPAALRNTNKPDSLVVINEAPDFGLINPQGQGPAGRLIRWETKETYGYGRTFTYDQAGRLIGSFQRDYGSQYAELARYQGDFLAEAFTKDVPTGFVFYLKRYQYDAQGRLSRTLLYGSGLDQPMRFHLADWLTHEYNAQGELQQVRFESNSMPDFYWMYTYQQGDCVRQEQYRRSKAGKPDDLREQIEVSYSAQLNPLMALPLYDEYKYRFSRRYAAASVTTLYQSGSPQRSPGCFFQVISNTMGRGG